MTHDEEEPVAGQDPHEIQREIEATRAELAETIDAIADRVSPKRVASRSAAKVKDAVDSVFGRDGSAEAPGSVLDTGRYRPPSPAQREQIGEVLAQDAGGAYTGATTYGVERTLRVDRVLMAVGAVAAVAAVIVIVRSNRK